MAGLKMPDFGQIDELIDSFEKLDREFGRIGPDTGERKQRGMPHKRRFSEPNT